MSYKNPFLKVESFKDGDLLEFKKECGVHEGVDYGCVFVTSRDENGNLRALIGFNPMLDEIYPRLEHIWISPKYHGSRLIIVMASAMEHLLKENGFVGYQSYIFDTSEMMQRLASKWKMRVIQVDEEGKWFQKDLVKEKDSVHV